MADSIRTPFPLIKDWARGTISLVPCQDGNTQFEYEHDFFDSSIDSDNFEQLADELQANATNALKLLLKYDEAFDPIFVLRLADSVSCWHRSHIGLFFTCLGILAPSEIIKIHWLFKSLITLISILPEDAFSRSYGLSLIDEKPPRHVMHILDECYDSNGWITAVNSTLTSWRQTVQDPEELRYTLALFQNQLGDATTIWSSIRQPLIELRDLHGLKLLDRFVKTIDTASAKLNLQLEECEMRALELEELAKNPVLPNTSSSALGADSGKSSVKMGLLNQHNGQAPGSRMPQREQWLVKSGVISMLIFSCPFAVVAAVLCEAAEGVPQYDSNFHSTISQMFVGFAGILAIIAPILNNWYSKVRRRQGDSSKNKGIETANPVLFYILILFSCMTLLTSVAVYPYHPLSSIPAAWVAGIAQNIATLLIIQDTGNKIIDQGIKIMDQGNKIMDQGERIVMLESDLAQARG